MDGHAEVRRHNDASGPSPNDSSRSTDLSLPAVSGSRLTARDVIARIEEADDGQPLTWSNVHISECLDLSRRKTERSLIFRNCHFDADLRLQGAEIRSLDMAGSTLDGNVHARDIRCGPMSMRAVSVKGTIDLRYARIDGPLELQGATLGATACESLDLRAARISSTALLADMRVSGAVAASGLVVEGLLDLTGTMILGAVWLAGEVMADGTVRRPLESDRVALLMDYANIVGPLLLRAPRDGRPFRATGLVRLLGSRVGALAADESQIRNNGQVCLNLERVQVTNSVLLRRSVLLGTVRLFASDIGDALEMDGAQVIAPKGAAISAERSCIKGPLLLRKGLTVHGATRFLNAELGSFVDCSGGSFTRGAVAEDAAAAGAAPYMLPVQDIALSFEGAKVSGNISLNDGFRADGRVDLRRTTVAGSVLLGDADNMASAQLRNEGVVVDAFALKVGQRLLVRNVDISGIVDLRHAECRILEDEAHVWPRRQWVTSSSEGSALRRLLKRVTGRDARQVATGTQFDGLTYDVLAGPAYGWSQRKRVLREAIDSERPHPYLQLADQYKRDGHLRRARSVQIARLNAMTSRWNPSRWIVRALIGYGYRPLRALVFLILAVAVSGYFIDEATDHDRMVPVGAAETDVVSSECSPPVHPCVQPYVYAADALLPVLDLRQRALWTPDPVEAPGLAAVVWLLSPLGWAIGLLVIAGFTNLIKKE